MISSKAVINKTGDYFKGVIAKENIAREFCRKILKEESCAKTIARKNNQVLHTTKAFDGRQLSAIESVFGNYDYVLMVPDLNEPIEISDKTESVFADQSLNTFKIVCGTSLNDYARLYLDVISWIDYLKKLHPFNKIFLYGKNLGANVLSAVLRTDTNHAVNAVILNQIETSIPECELKKFCSEKNYVYDKSLYHITKDELKNIYHLKLDTIDKPASNLSYNRIPVIFISQYSKKDASHKDFLNVYNSTNGIRKVLFTDDEMGEISLIEMLKVISELKKY